MPKTNLPCVVAAKLVFIALSCWSSTEADEPRYQIPDASQAYQVRENRGTGEYAEHFLSLRYSNDGQTLISAGQEFEAGMVVKYWDVASGRVSKSIPFDTSVVADGNVVVKTRVAINDVRQMLLSPNQKWLSVPTREQQVWTFELAMPTNPVARFQEDFIATCFTPSNELLAASQAENADDPIVIGVESPSASRGGNQQNDASKTGKTLFEIAMKSEPGSQRSPVTVVRTMKAFALAHHPSRSIIATSLVQTGKASVSRGGSRAALRNAIRGSNISGKPNCTVTLWNRSSGEPLATIENVGYSTHQYDQKLYYPKRKEWREKATQDYYGRAVFSPDGRTLMAGQSLIDVESSKVRARLAEAGTIFDAAFAPTGAWFATIGYVSDTTDQDRQSTNVLQFWETATGKRLASLDLGETWFFDVHLAQPSPPTLAISGDGTRVATTLGYQTIRFWDANRILEQRHRIPLHDRILQPINRSAALSAWQLGTAWAKSVVANLEDGQGREAQKLRTEAERLAASVKMQLPPLPRRSGSALRDLRFALQQLLSKGSELGKQLAAELGSREAYFFDLAVNAQLIPLLAGTRQAPMLGSVASALKRANQSGALPATISEPLSTALDSQASPEDLKAKQQAFVGEVATYLSGDTVR